MIDNSKIAQKLTNKGEEKVKCDYQNLSSNWQIIKITNMPSCYSEKVVLPRQKITFKSSIK